MKGEIGEGAGSVIKIVEKKERKKERKIDLLFHWRDWWKDSFDKEDYISKKMYKESKRKVTWTTEKAEKMKRNPDPKMAASLTW